MNTKEYIVKIPVFEGPLDLLWHLVRKNKLNIFDLPMALITEQYLQYLEMMRALNLEIAGEYLLMAATLIYIKSQMLLPREEKGPEEPVEDPRLQIVEPLLELAKYQEAAKWLSQRSVLNRDVFVPPPQIPEDNHLEVSLFDLLSALKKVLHRRPPEVYEVARARVILTQKIEEIMTILATKGKIYLSELLALAKSREEAIAYFLAILELAFREKIRLLQNTPWEEVEILRRE